MPIRPGANNPLPWRKQSIYERETSAGRKLKKWIIVDAISVEVCSFYYITPETEQTVDFILERANADVIPEIVGKVAS